MPQLNKTREHEGMKCRAFCEEPYGHSLFSKKTLKICQDTLENCKGFKNVPVPLLGE